MKGVSFSIIGCGRAGNAFARYLSEAGYPPAGFASKTMASARHAAAYIGYRGNVSTKPWEVVGDADIILITTPDDAIRNTAEQIASRGKLKSDAVVFHCSGALSSEALSSLKASGVSTGSIHPLQSFAVDTGKNPFEGIMIGVEGDREAVDMAWQIAKDLGAAPFKIETAGKMLYHASAVAASNFLVTLMKFAMDLLMASGVEPDRAFGILKPLVMGTLSNVENAGPVEALTGPIVRGDSDIVRAHVNAIDHAVPQMTELYKTIGKYTVEIAAQRNTLSDESLKELLGILNTTAKPE